MKLSIRAAALVLAALALVPPNASAQASRNAKFGVQITFPKGWIVAEPQVGPIIFAARGSDAEARATCVAGVEETPATRSFTQAQINAQMKTPFGRQFWLQVFQGAQGVTIHRDGSREHPAGIVIQEVEATTVLTAETGPMRAYQIVLMRPGISMSVACATRPAFWERYKATFYATINSIRFGGGAPGTAGGLEANAPLPTDAAVPVAFDETPLNAPLPPSADLAAAAQKAAAEAMVK
jgi:hypothetical protein